MMRGIRLFSLAWLPIVTFAAQPSAPAPKEVSIRKLQWSQLNFLHTTDTHGWHGGHLQEYELPHITSI